MFSWCQVDDQHEDEEAGHTTSVHLLVHVFCWCQVDDQDEDEEAVYTASVNLLVVVFSLRQVGDEDENEEEEAARTLSVHSPLMCSLD